jgi:hypothetical protein
MEKKEEDKSGGEHVNFVYNIGVEEKARSFCVDSTTSAVHSHLKLQLTEIYLDSKALSKISLTISIFTFS